MDAPDVSGIGNPRQKRSRMEGSHSRKGEAKMSRACSECGKTFWSWKALFGHMRCHPERQWRGINPPTTLEDHQVAQSLLLLANDKPLDVTEEIRFECSSCKKVFASHQALGGHRASHKNVKGCFAITRSTHSEIDHDLITTPPQYDHPNLTRSSTVITTHMCTICLRVFSSGQALGGHKRCHWDQEPSVNHGYAYAYAYANSRGGFDLNLPPQPEDDHTATVTSSGGSYSSGLTLDLRLGL